MKELMHQCHLKFITHIQLECGELMEISLEQAIPKRDVGFLYRHATLKENPAVEGFITYIKERIS